MDSTTSSSSLFDIKLSSVCNLTTAHLTLYPNHINILFGANGIGKSSIAKAVSYQIRNETDRLALLKKYGSNPTDNPLVNISAINAVAPSSCLVFDEDYVSSFLFKENDVANNTYELFAKVKGISDDNAALSPKVRDIINTLASEPITQFYDFVESRIKKLDIQKAVASGETVKKTTILGKMQKSASVADSFSSPSLSGYKPYLKDSGVEFPKWISAGQAFFKSNPGDIYGDNCPFCLSKVKNLQAIIKSFSSEAKANNIVDAQKKEQLYGLFSALVPENQHLYISLQKSTELSPTDVKIIEGPISKLEGEYAKINDMRNFDLLEKGVGSSKISTYFSSRKLDSSVIGKTISPEASKAADMVNAAIDSLLAEAKALDEKMADLNRALQERIQEKETILNDFLDDAGIPYNFQIVSNGTTIVTILEPKGGIAAVDSVKTHLSYGEKNVISCMLFALEAASMPQNSLIIFDDPLSSFDATKKYALLYRLFNKAINGGGEHGIFENLSGKTILIVTHDFDIVTYVFHSKLGIDRSNDVSVRYGFTKDGVFSEKDVKKESLITDYQICVNGYEKGTNMFSRLTFLRKRILLESDPKTLTTNPVYQTISNLLKRRPHANATVRSEEDGKESGYISESVLDAGVSEIKAKLSLPDSVTYDDLLSNFSNEILLANVKHYSDYEKLLCVRILGDFGGFDTKLAQAMGETAAVFWKAANECYHIENDSLYSLNSEEFPTIPEFLIAFCDNWLEKAAVLADNKHPD